MRLGPFALRKELLCSFAHRDQNRRILYNHFQCANISRLLADATAPDGPRLQHLRRITLMQPVIRYAREEGEGRDR